MVEDQSYGRGRAPDYRLEDFMAIGKSLIYTCAPQAKNCSGVSVGNLFDAQGCDTAWLAIHPVGAFSSRRLVSRFRCILLALSTGSSSLYFRLLVTLGLLNC
jgi:hypothetical protein